MKRPKYSNLQKRQNHKAVKDMMASRAIAGIDVIERSEYHWTLNFKNGHRIDMSPTMVGLFERRKKMKFYSLESLFEEVDRLASLPPRDAETPEAAE